MDFVKDVTVIEEDLEDVNNKCDKIQCIGVYSAIKAVIKLIVDIFKCSNPKIFNLKNIMYYIYITIYI